MCAKNYSRQTIRDHYYFDTKGDTEAPLIQIAI